MNLFNVTHALRMSVSFRLTTPLLLRSGQTGDFTDSTIERTPNGDLHINGYVWASLICRSLARLQGGKDLAATIGKYQEKEGISPLWCEASTTNLHGTLVTPGIRISRKWGAAESTALFTDELAMAGLPIQLNFTFFCTGKDDAVACRSHLLQAFWVINEGIENIGGGWGYGYGRLTVENVKAVELSLETEAGREQLWGTMNPDIWKEIQLEKPEITGHWTKINVRAKVADGQLLAIKTGTVPFDLLPVGKLPDTFVFRRNRLEPDGGLTTGPVITGKAIRQTLFSVPLERKWRSLGTSKVCAPNTDKTECNCPRCRWFGSVNAAGLIAVSDAPVDNPVTEIINRVQLCEHSMQNMNLFSGEYLVGGSFNFNIYIDQSRPDCPEILINEVTELLEEMKGNNAPTGWYRLGGTSTCTGQVEVIDYKVTRSDKP